MQNLVNFMGLFGSILIALSFIPQTYSVIKKKDAKHISIWFILINILSTVLMIAYGLINRVIPMIIANTSVLINNLIIFYYYLMLKKN